MTWVRLDDQFARHPKVIQAGPLGQALFTAGLCYCAQYLTDGFIPAKVALTLLDLDDEFIAATPEQLIARLVDAGLWTTSESGYQVHDYLDYQPASTKVKGERAAARERMRRLRSPEQEPNDTCSPELRETFARSSRPPTVNPTIEPVPDQGPDREPVPVMRAGAREADGLWSVLEQLCGVPATDDERAEFATTVRQLAKARATAGELAGFGPWWHAHHDVRLTHKGVRRHWGAYRTGPGPPNGTRPSAVRAGLDAVDQVGEIIRSRAEHGL